MAKKPKPDPIKLVRLEIIDHGSRLEVVASQPDARAVTGRHERSKVVRTLPDAWHAAEGYAAAMIRGDFLPRNRADVPIAPAPPPDFQLDDIDDEPTPTPKAEAETPSLF